MRLEWPLPTIEPNWLETRWPEHAYQATRSRSNPFYDTAKQEMQVIECILDGCNTRPKICKRLGLSERTIGIRLKGLLEARVLERYGEAHTGYRYSVRPI